MNGPLKLAVAVVVAGVLVTAVLFGVARHLLVTSFQGTFAADVSTRARIVQNKLQEAVLISRAVAGFAQTAGVQDREAFNAFTRNFLAESTGLTALSLVAVVARDERAAFEAKARGLSGRADFAIYEGAPGAATRPAGARDVYYPVLFTNTRDATAMVVLGYDLGSSPIRLAALERARDTGAAAVTERITLFGTAGNPGFIVFSPVYGVGGAAPETEADRRAAISAFVQAIFSPDNLIASALEETIPVGMPFDLLDLSAPADRQIVCRWSARLHPQAAWKSLFIPEGVHSLREISFAGRGWGIDVRPNAAYLEKNYPVAHWLIVPVGVALSLFLGAYSFAVLSSREKLVALNATLESEIGKSARLIAQLQRAQREITTLEGILPICASCKKIRDERDRWVAVEAYVSRHTSAEFTHGICPECAEKLYPEYAGRARPSDPVTRSRPHADPGEQPAQNRDSPGASSDGTASG